MPRYFFDATTGCDHRDEERVDFPDDMTAYVAAVQFVGELLVDNPTHLLDGHRLNVSVRDADG